MYGDIQQPCRLLGFLSLDDSFTISLRIVCIIIHCVVHIVVYVFVLYYMGGRVKCALLLCTVPVYYGHICVCWFFFLV